MGLFDNIRNLAKRIFQPKKWREEQEQIRIEKEIDEQEQKNKEEILTKQEEKQIKKEQEQKQELITTEPQKEITEQQRTLSNLPKEDLTEKGRQLSLDGETINVPVAINESRKKLADLYKGKNLKSESEINTIINENLAITGTGIAFDNISDGLSYKKLLKDAILQNTIKVDDQIAELIAQNSDRFRPRFTTTIEIYLSGNTNRNIPDVLLIFQGGLPHEVCEDVKEVMREGDTWESQRILATAEFMANEEQKYGIGATIRTNRRPSNPEQITKIINKVNFK